MLSNIRLSRIGHPRATWWAVALLVVVFLGLGLWAEAYLPDVGSTAPQISELEPSQQLAWLKDVVVGF